MKTQEIKATITKEDIERFLAHINCNSSVVKIRLTKDGVNPLTSNRVCMFETFITPLEKFLDRDQCRTSSKFREFVNDSAFNLLRSKLHYNNTGNIFWFYAQS